MDFGRYVKYDNGSDLTSFVIENGTAPVPLSNKSLEAASGKVTLTAQDDWKTGGGRPGEPGGETLIPARPLGNTPIMPVSGQRYYDDIPNDIIPQGYHEVENTDENGDTYWTLGTDEVPHGLANLDKQNPITGSLSSYIPHEIIFAGELFLLYFLLSKRIKFSKR